MNEINPTTIKEQQKSKAIELLKQLNIYEPYIKGFEEENQVCFFEKFNGFWVFQEPEIEAKMREIENKYNCMIYAITHEYIHREEMYSFLIVTKYQEDWDNLLQNEGHNEYYATAYVWNRDCEYCSEFGDVLIESAFGGIKRIG